MPSMQDLIEELERLVELFDREDLDYALCGGLALVLHGHVRATLDIDMLVPRAELARAQRLAKESGFDIPARKMIFGLRSQTQREMQRVSKLDPDTKDLLSLDLIVVEPDFEEVWQGREAIEWLGRDVSIVSREGLILMKRLAGRPKDLVDIATLEGKDENEAP